MAKESKTNNESKTEPSRREPSTGRGFGFEMPQFGRGFGAGRGFETPRRESETPRRGFEIGRGFGRERGFEFGRGDRRYDERPRLSEKEKLEKHIASLEEELKHAKNELKKL